MAMVFWGKSRK